MPLNVSEEGALAELEPGGLFRIFRAPLQKVALVYVPFRLYEVEIRNGDHSERKLFALDAVKGNLDLVGFEAPPVTEEIRPANQVPARLRAGDGSDAVSEAVRRMVFKGGFFKLKDFGVRAWAVREFYWPYWVGFYGSGEMVSLAVLDAVRRKKEGAKVKELLMEWMAG